jgi:hypothetical protein
MDAERAGVARDIEGRPQAMDAWRAVPRRGPKKALDTKSPSMIMFRMLRKTLSARGVIPVIMCFQVVPLLVFPISSYTTQSQEWWLPALLTVAVVVALVQILVRRTTVMWPWYMVSFAQGVNIISRLMMFLPHSTTTDAGVTTFNAAYVIISVAAMLCSAFEIWYNELPEVRRKLLPS